MRKYSIELQIKQKNFDSHLTNNLLLQVQRLKKILSILETNLKSKTQKQSNFYELIRFHCFKVEKLILNGFWRKAVGIN
jgi:hypothetical protein